MSYPGNSPRSLLSRRSVLASLGSVGAVALLAACGASRPAITAGSASAGNTTSAAAGNNTPDSAATAKAAGYTAAAPTATVGQIKSTGKNGTIQYWHNHSGTELAPLNANIQEFTKLNDIGVEATYVPVPAGTQESPKLIAAIAGGTPPDAARFDRFIVGSFAFTGSLSDLTAQAAKAGITAKDYYNFSWSEASLEGKLYAIPTSTDVRILYYNKDHFSAAGLDPEKPPTTIQELDDTAAKLTKKDGTRYSQIGFIPWLGQGWLYTYGWLWGGSFYDDKSGMVTTADPKNIAAATWYGSYGTKYSISDIDAFQASFGSNAQDPFLVGLVSMQVSTNGTVNSIKQYKPDMKYGLAVLPVAPGQTSTSTWSGGWSNVIPKGVKNLDTAFTFVKYMGSAQGQLTWAKNASGAFLPTSTEAAKDPYFPQANGATWDMVTKLLTISHWRPVIPEGNELWNELADAGDTIRHGKSDPKTVFTAIDTKVNGLLAKDKWKGTGS